MCRVRDMFCRVHEPKRVSGKREKTHVLEVLEINITLCFINLVDLSV